MIGKSFAAASLAVLLSWSGARGQNAEQNAGQPEGDGAEAGHALAEKLVQVGDAQSLATAALVYRAIETRHGSGDQVHDALALIRRAGEIAPDAAHLAWLELRLCVGRGGCDPRPAARRLASLDPGNGAALLHEFPGDDASRASVDRFLQRLGQAGHMDSYWNRLVVMVHEAIGPFDGRSTPDPAGDRLDGRMDVFLAAGDLTPFVDTRINAACGNEATTDSTRRDVCLRIARAFQSGDTLLAESWGQMLEVRLWEPGSAEQRAVLQRREASGALASSLGRHMSDPYWSERWLSALRGHRTEQQAYAALAAMDWGPATVKHDVANPFSSLRALEADETAPGVASLAAPTTASVPKGSRLMHLQPFDVNFLAVAVAAASAFLLGGVWYSRGLFGLVWSREAGMPADKAPHGPKVFATSFALALIAAWLFAAILPATVTIGQATLFGALVGAGWVASSFGINYGFGNRSFKLWAIDAGYHTLQFTLYGAILGAWR